MNNKNEINKYSDHMIRNIQTKCIEKLRKVENEDKYFRVVLMVSYCRNNPLCTDELPCPYCLRMSNIAL